MGQAYSISMVSFFEGQIRLSAKLEGLYIYLENYTWNMLLMQLSLVLYRLIVKALYAAARGN